MSNDRTPVDDLITAIPGNWEFDAQVASTFETHVRKSIPFYDAVQQLTVEISEFFIRDGSVVYDIGSSTGETLRILSEKHQNKKDVHFFGIEQSLTMVEEAKKKNQERSCVSILHQDINKFSAFENADLILSLYTLNFLPLEKRHRLIQKIHDDLQVGGAFIFVEKVYGEHSVFQDIWSEIHWDFKRQQNLSDEMVLEKARSLRGIMLPMTCKENIRMLRLVGFTTVDVFFKWLNWCGFIAIKMNPNLSGLNLERSAKQFPEAMEKRNS